MTKNTEFSITSAERYSLALFELAEESNLLIEIEDQALSLLDLINQSDDFCNFVKDPTINQEDLLKAINTIVENNKLNTLFKNFLNFLIKKRRFFFIERILKSFIETCSRKRGELKATSQDWSKEYLDPTVSVKSVKNLDEAILHINKYGTMHTDCIITQNKKSANKFLKYVKSSIAMHNTSTQFADGGEFGFGGEIGISTNNLPPRGPVGLNQLVSYKYKITSKGSIRK